MDEAPKAIPYTASKPLDLAEVAAEAGAGPKPIPLRDAVAMFGFIACCVCYRGGHTRTTLYTVFKDGTGREKVKACSEHVGQFVRPKDVGR